MTNSTNHRSAHEPGRRSTSLRLVPIAWLALSATWAAVVVVTDHAAVPLALWIATTVGPLTAIERRHRCRSATGTSGATT